MGACPVKAGENGGKARTRFGLVEFENSEEADRCIGSVRARCYEGCSVTVRAIPVRCGGVVEWLRGRCTVNGWSVLRRLEDKGTALFVSGVRKWASEQVLVLCILSVGGLYDYTGRLQSQPTRGVRGRGGKDRQCLGGLRSERHSSGSFRRCCYGRISSNSCTNVGFDVSLPGSSRG